MLLHFNKKADKRYLEEFLEPGMWKEMNELKGRLQEAETKLKQLTEDDVEPVERPRAASTEPKLDLDIFEGVGGL
jgi:hypothetical protein